MFTLNLKREFIVNRLFFYSSFVNKFVDDFICLADIGIGHTDCFHHSHKNPCMMRVKLENILITRRLANRK